MDDRNAQVGWTEAQWNRVREEVLQAWQRVRVAGSFLPVYGPLPPSTQVVPTEVLKDGSVDDRATAALVEIALPVTLSRQQIWEEDLSSALLQFRRRATQLGQLEDWFIFNGTYPSEEAFRAEERGLPHYRPKLAYLNPEDDDSKRARISGTPTEIDGLDQNEQLARMRERNPGSLGLIEGRRLQPAQPGENRPELNNAGLIEVILNAINSLEEKGYIAPYVCVLGRKPFQEAFAPIKGTTVFPRDRIEPLIRSEILHASAIDILPQGSDIDRQDDWQSRGVLLSVADEPIDLALAAEATAEFRQVGLDGRYVFSVFESFALRIKDTNAIAPLMFETSGGAGNSNDAGNSR
jgi:uncharacterized linocin/CFP29 family protein